MNKPALSITAVFLCSIISASTFASNLDSQLMQIQQIEQKTKADQEAAERLQEAKAEEAQRRRTAAIAAERKRKEAKAQAKYEKFESERLADKKREQDTKILNVN